ncbi:nucleolar transcription factor 1-A-like [Culicoides brevitarsis]|uniref:nucleolar transcription factor 1-A-like n=1 Tax=Culicoides brevitarsis TaxID=469753 RepID=UPI00307C35BB
MRNRSKSTIELSSKFEEEELDINDVQSDEEGSEETFATPLNEPDHLAEQVIEKVLASLPSHDTVGYTKTIKKIKWDEIEVDGKKPHELEKIFHHAIKDVNKVRTLTEIINDAKQRMSSFHQHPDHPKRPKTMFAMFVQERFKQIKDENPDIENNDVMKKCSEEFKNLSEKKKNKLMARHAALLEDYNDRMAKYQLKHPDLKKSSAKKASKMSTPLAFYWADRSKELGKSDLQTYGSVRKEWMALDAKTRAIYLRKFFAENETETLTKAERKAFLEAKGAPTRPGTAFGVFLQDNIQKYKHLESKERIKKIADLWAKLDKSVKERYTNDANVELELYNQKWKKFVKGLTKEELKWIETPKSGSKRKKESPSEDTDTGHETDDKKSANKKQKTKTSTALPEPQKPPENVIEYFAMKKCDGDKKEAKKKWKTLKESKKEKYEKQLENLQSEYFNDLKAYLKSLSTEEVKEYKKRMKSVKEDEKSDDDENGDNSD